MKLANMEVEVTHREKLEVKITGKSVVRASIPLLQPHILTLSNLDLLSGRFPVSYFYFYRTPLANEYGGSTIEALKTSLAKTLNHFYPFAGRILENPSTSEPEIICNNDGALLVEARANLPLKDLNFYNLDQSLIKKLVSIDHDYPFQIQVTCYTCGGISMTFTFDHALGDASAFSRFLVTWSEIAMKKPISCVPDHRRYLRARSPPTYDPSLDQNFVSCTIEEIANIPTNNILLKRLYHIDVSSINRLQRLAGTKTTKIEAFSAYIWKVMARVIDKSKTHEKCKFGWLIDGRTRMSRDPKFINNYIGNVLSLAFGEANVAELKQGSISEVAKIVHEAISKVTNEAHFLDLIDWIECHRPGLMLSKIVLGQAGPAIVISSGRRFPVVELDFGFGSPVLGTVCSTIEKIGVGYINQRQSSKGDGSWSVSAILWPELVDALESDSDCVFQPMNANHLQL